MSIDISPKALFLAIQADDEKRFEEILKNGGDPDSVTSVRYPYPLHQAVLRGNATIIDALITHGADLDVLCPILYATPLFCACALGHDRIARTLVAAGARANTPDMLGNSPALAAAFGGHQSIVQALADHGCDVTAPNTLGLSPSFYEGKPARSGSILRDGPPHLDEGIDSIRMSVERVEMMVSIVRDAVVASKAEPARNVYFEAPAYLQ
jgi:hypothetical protein